MVNFLVNFLPKSIGCDFNSKIDFRIMIKVSKAETNMHTTYF